MAARLGLPTGIARQKIMHSAARTAPVSNKRLWAGRVLSALPVLFLLFDGAIKFTNLDPVVEANARLGYSMSLAPGIGIVELVCTVVYLLPRTSILGAILLSGHLGGAP